MKNERPYWKHHCELCLACMHFCLVAVIQWGPKTAKRGRYTHPAIYLGDMKKQRGEYGIEYQKSPRHIPLPFVSYRFFHPINLEMIQKSPFRTFQQLRFHLFFLKKIVRNSAVRLFRFVVAAGLHNGRYHIPRPWRGHQSQSPFGRGKDPAGSEGLLHRACL